MYKIYLAIPLILCMGCLSQPIEEANNVLKDRIEQVDHTLEDKVTRLENDLKEQSELWRKTLQDETSKTREFVTSERKQLIEDLRSIVNSLPEVIGKSTSESLKSAGFKMKPGENGTSQVDWSATLIAVGGAILGLFQIYRNWTNKKAGKKRHTDPEIHAIVQTAIQKALPPKE